jgi:hypothetical protein
MGHYLVCYRSLENMETIWFATAPQSRQNECANDGVRLTALSSRRRRNKVEIINTGNEHVRKLIGQKLIVKLINVIKMRMTISIERNLCRVKYLRYVTLSHMFIFRTYLTSNILKTRPVCSANESLSTAMSKLCCASQTDTTNI